MSAYRQNSRAMAGGMAGGGMPTAPIPSRNTMPAPAMPDFSRLADDFNVVSPANGVSPRPVSYEGSDLDEITRRQLHEDITAYKYDLDYCNNCLTLPDLTPQEQRTMQLRILDIGHRVRSCQHHLEIMAAQKRLAASGINVNGNSSRSPYSNGQYMSSLPNAASAGVKRPRAKRPKNEADSSAMDVSISALTEGGNDTVADGSFADTSSVQRLGFWKCRLCTSSKFLNAGPNRVPSAPCKWPLKDVSKMLNHFLDLHTEHSPAERCIELGNALGQNRGPFEYWLTRTRSQDLEDLSVLEDYIETLQGGNLPEPLRALNRAAAAFPNLVSGCKK